VPMVFMTNAASQRPFIGLCYTRRSPRTAVSRVQTAGRAQASGFAGNALGPA
jgi:hypothetical protein